MTGSERAEVAALLEGAGPAVTIIPGFGLDPSTYHATAEALATRATVIVPDLLEAPGAWSDTHWIDGFLQVLDTNGIDRTVLVSHSFGGALALSLANDHPERLRAMIFVDTAGLSNRWRLARRAIPGSYLYRLATKRAAVGFLRGALRHPIKLAHAGLWAFWALRRADRRGLAESSLPVHILWAERDTLLRREDGKRFAEQLGADFRIIRDQEGGGPVDHDWVYRHPHILPEVLDDLGYLERAAARTSD